MLGIARMLALATAGAGISIASTSLAQVPPEAAPPAPASGYAPAPLPSGYAPPPPLAPFQAPQAYSVYPLQAPYSAPIRPPMERRSTGMMAGGIALSSAGAALLVTSGFLALMYAVDNVPDCGSMDEPHPCIPGNTHHYGNAATGTLVGALVSIAVGIPLIVIGSKKVPVSGPPSARKLLPTWAGAPGRAGWSFQF